MEGPERRRQRQRQRRSRTKKRAERSPRGSRSPPGSAGTSRSESKRENKSSNKRSKSPREKRSRSPHHVIAKVKQEREEHSQRGHEERQYRDHSELDRRWESSGDRDRHRDHSGRRKSSRGRPASYERERDAHHLHNQQAQREFYNEQRREHREQIEASGDEENRGAGGPNSISANKEPGNKEKPSFELSGALLEDSNTFRGVVIKYSKPPEARIPKKRWRLYPFKNDEVLPVMYIHRQSAYLLGRHRRIADIPIDHPSCSKQHAVFQYRLVEYTRPDGTIGRKVKPYIIDLGSGNGTFLNNQRIEPQRYYELKEKDVLKFGFSSREYVLLHESSDTS
ncbi:smad nuclear-interacting protein 1-like isoform X1 [Rhineura floridana]|uniref:smad nuclear-interacting protein 1-like isoform X1 n=1 Tax=Rhineura floridana TaxID=261503 RepID=UPI002AC858E8|nr:smad nuclear-interacting protein 1-like isoform X1 [Rhineura floridana]